MQKLKLNSVKLIKKAALWISSSAVIFILLLLLLYACCHHQSILMKHMKPVIYAFLLFFLTFVEIRAQNTGKWQWPEDTAKAKTMWVLFTDALKDQKYQDATSPFQWLLEKAPHLNPSLYINGQKLYQGLATAAHEPEQKRKYQEQELALYDMRMQYFQHDGSVINRKAYAAYAYYRDQPGKYQELYEIFEKAFQTAQSHFSNASLVAYMNVIRLFQSMDNSLTEEEVLEKYEQITKVLQSRKSSAGPAGIDEKQTLIDNLLIATVTLDCALINEKFGKPFLDQKHDLAKAKRIVVLSLACHCKDLPVFLEAARVVQEKEPAFGLAKLMALMYDAQNDDEKAEYYYQEAVNLSEDTTKKAEMLYALAIHYQRRGMKEASREFALKALETDSSQKEAYKLIGDLYFSSFADCKEGKRATRDRAVYIAAYEMYRLAGRAALMEQAQQQFPSIDEIFQEGFQEGQPISTGCWINETVTLRRRPKLQ